MVVENISEIIYSMTLPDGRLAGNDRFPERQRQADRGIRDRRIFSGTARRSGSVLIHPDDLPDVKEDTRRMVRDRDGDDAALPLAAPETGKISGSRTGSFRGSTARAG